MTGKTCDEATFSSVNCNEVKLVSCLVACPPKKLRCDNDQIVGNLLRFKKSSFPPKKK